MKNMEKTAENNQQSIRHETGAAKGFSGPLIDKVSYYACGYCTNYLGLIIKNPGEKKKDFPAGVFLLHHVKYGYILFDTGLAPRNNECGIKSIAFNLFNPACVEKGDSLAWQLKRDGISPKEVRYIILSHLHPDHIGGLKDFPKAKIICSMDCYKQYKKGNARDVIFKELLPDNFEKRLYRVKEYDSKYAFFYGYDLFRDGSVLLTDISGHAKGQMGAYLWEHRIFLAADAAWGQEFLDRADEMSQPARLVQNDFLDYKRSMELMKQMTQARVSVYFSHESGIPKNLVDYYSKN